MCICQMMKKRFFFKMSKARTQGDFDRAELGWLFAKGKKSKFTLEALREAVHRVQLQSKNGDQIVLPYYSNFYLCVCKISVVL